MKRFNWTVEEKTKGQTVRNFLQKEKSFSRRMIKQLNKKIGYVRVNGKSVTTKQKLNKDDLLTIYLKENKSDIFQPIEVPLNIIYEDDDLLVINKQQDLLMIPTKYCNYSLANGVLNYYKEKNLPFTVHIVTRLDRFTSGLVLIAKHRYAHHLLSLMQKERRIKRVYEAILHGKLNVTNGTIHLPIDRHDESIIQRDVKKGGKEAKTHFKTITSNDNYTFVEVELETGRTHQIRVHFSYLGYPIVGDTLYSPFDESKQKRQYLHCKYLSFVHPFTKERIILKKPSRMNEFFIHS